MQEVITEIINNNTTIIPDLSQPFSGETLYETCDLYIGFKSNLLPVVEIEYSDGIQRVTLERLTRMENKTYAIHFLFDRNYFINRDYEIELFSVSGTIRTTDLDIKRDFDLNINQYGSHLEYTGENYIMFTSSQDGSTIGLLSRSTNQTTLEYFTEQSTGWRDLTPAETITVNSGECVYVRGILTGNNTNADYTNFRLVGNISVSGNCNAIWSYNNLNADLYQYCGHKLFSNCSGLIDVENMELPATTLANRCYYDMFWGCTSLTTAPGLPATTLADRCYEGMFSNCTSLTTAPELPATTLADSCYSDMFSGCIGLTTAPDLPATTLAHSCYSYMFYGCTSLTTAPALPATTLAYQCYYAMFDGCTGLTAAPELPATTLADYCYGSMFNRCTSLNYIKCLAVDKSAISQTASWTRDVSASGTFIKSQNISENTWGRGIDGIPSGWTVIDCPQTLCITNIGRASTTISFPIVREEGGTPYPDVEYSKNSGQTWAAWDYNDENIVLQRGECVYLRGDNPGGFNSGVENGGHTDYRTRRIDITGGLVELSGNIMGLLDYGACTATTIPCASCFMDLFGSGSPQYGIKYAHRLQLPSMSLKNYTYSAFFKNCKNLITAPELPAIDLRNTHGVYNHMFNGCESLTEAPILPALYLGRDSYGAMFYHCHSLKKCPELIAQELTTDCYSTMFGDCISLKEPPELQATSTTPHCYYAMFAGCTNLEYAPELPAINTADRCYTRMFMNCVKLKKAPLIAAEELVNGPQSGSCQEMFSGCSELREVKCLAISGITGTGNSAYRWMYGTPNTGVFIKHPDATWVRSASGIKNGWTVYGLDNYIIS